MQPIDPDKFFRVLFKYYYGLATKEELQLVEEQLRESPIARQQWEDLKTAIAKEEQMKHETTETKKQPRRTARAIHINPSLVSLAATLLLLLGGYALYVYQQPQIGNHKSSRDVAIFHPVVNKKVILQLANGSVLHLAGNNNLDITQPAPGIDSIVQGRLDNRYDTVNNTLTVPRGVTYAIGFTDGTAAYINSATRLKFPLIFNSSRREIYLDEGEAYLRVANDSRNPFVVHTSKGDVVAPGGSFNVRMYNGKLSVSLVTGLVAIVHQHKTLKLSPGQQASSKAGQNGFSLTRFDNHTSPGWLKGRYPFKNATLTEVCEMIERVYDVDVIIDEPYLAEQHFNGAVFKDTPVETVAKNISETGSFRYYFDEKRRLHFR